MKQKELIIRENIRPGRNHNDRFSTFFPVLEYRVIKKGPITFSGNGLYCTHHYYIVFIIKFGV